MEDDVPQVQPMRSVNKSSVDSALLSPDAPTVFIACYQDPTTKKGIVLWDDIRLAFTDALHVRNQARVLPFLKGADFMPLMPLRIAAIPDVILDVVVDDPLVRLEATVAQTTIAETPRISTIVKPPQEDTTTKHSNAAVVNTPRRNPVYGLEEMAMDNYSHIDNPAWGRDPRAPQLIPSSEQEQDTSKSASNTPKSSSGSTNNNPQTTSDMPTSNTKRLQSPQDHAAAASSRDIAPIVVKATLGDPVSQVELGNMYKAGDGVEQDYTAAYYWYLKAANQGDPSAQCNIGDHYLLGHGVDVNFPTAFVWYSKAADQGDAAGEYNVGFMHDYGLVGDVDFTKARSWYLKAANQGHALAQCNLGIIYENGQDVPQDFTKAMEWYLLSAEQDHPNAQLKIGLMYEDGRGVTKDDTVALEWLHKAASRKYHDAGAQIAMASMYYRGIGVPQDDIMAFVWYQKAALQGSPVAQYQVGTRYFYGVGVPQDDSQAILWLMRSAKYNLPEAQCNIGLLYLHGRGVPRSYLTAKEWFSKAAKIGYEPALTGLSHVEQLIDAESNGTVEEIIKSLKGSIYEEGFFNTLRNRLFRPSSS